MAKRRGHPGLAVFIGLLAVVVAAVAAGGWSFVVFYARGQETPPKGPPSAGEIAIAVAALALLLAAGLWCAWRVGTGRWSVRRPEGTVARTTAGRGRVWRVPEPGAALWDSPRGSRVLARLAPGTIVVEVERQGERIKVTTPDGATGWVEYRSVL